MADTAVPNSSNTGKTAKVTYAVGEASGPIMMADLVFAEYSVSSQAFCKSHSACIQHHLIYLLMYSPRNT